MIQVRNRICLFSSKLLNFRLSLYFRNKDTYFRGFLGFITFIVTTL